jgi:hypothetical protein
MYARGILFGKMKYELGDHSFVRCPELDLAADIEFKTKGWVGGTYNAIGGAIKRESTGEVLFELSGLWSEEMYIKDMTVGANDCAISLCLANRSRLATARCSSTPYDQSLLHLQYDQLRNRRSENLNDSGTRPPGPSRSGTTSLRLTRRQRLKTDSVRRLPNEPRKISSGTHDCSEEFKVAPVVWKKARKTWNGLLTLTCKY